MVRSLAAPLFLEQRQDAHWVRFFLLETVAAIDAKEVGSQAQALDQRLAEAHRLVGQDGHRQAGVVQAIERFSHAWINVGVIEHVLAVVVQKVTQGALDIGFARIRAERAAHQDRRPAADVSAD